MNNLPDEMMAMAVQAAPKGYKQPPPAPVAPKKTKSSKTEETPAPASGLVTWNEGVSNRFKAKFPHDVSEWNRKDFVKYIAHVYYEATGGGYIYALLMDYQNLQDFEHRLRQQGKREPTNQMLKDYIDFAFKKYITPMLGRGKKMTTRLFCSDQFTMDFLEQYKPVAFVEKTEPQAAQVAEVESETAVNLRALEDAYAINSRFFELNYGPIIHINFLVLVKGLPIQQAMNSAEAGMVKASATIITAADEILAATKKMGPYPRWFPFLDVKKLKKHWLSEIVICDDSETLGFLKPFAKNEV